MIHAAISVDWEHKMSQLPHHKKFRLWRDQTYGRITLTGLGDITILTAIAAVVYFLQSLAWPLSAGRDHTSYLIYYLEMGQPEPLYHLLMLFRTPGAPIFHGLALQLGGSLLDEILMGILFCMSILIVYRIGLRWNRRIAWVTALALSLYPGYGIPYHQVSSQGLFAFTFLFFAWLVFETHNKPHFIVYALLGSFIFLLVMIRPAAQAMLSFAAYPFFLPGLPTSGKLKRSFLFLLVSLSLLAAYSIYNLIHYDDFTVSRSSGAMLPLYRLFVSDRIPFRAENGPASTIVLKAIETDLLTREPYLSYGIDLETFVTSGDSRMHGDLVPLSDRTWGWESDYQMLFKATLETVTKNPLFFTYRVSRSFGGAFLRSLTLAAPKVDSHPEQNAPTEGGLTKPSEGQSIPASNTWWLASSPDQRVQYDWENYYQTGALTISDQRLQGRNEALQQQLQMLTADLPARNGSTLMANILNSITRLYPPMLFWLLLGVASIFSSQSANWRTLWFLISLSFIYLGILYSGAHAIVYFRAPFDPLYILAGVTGNASLWSIIRRNRVVKNAAVSK
jgi:hypothetical protein